ncbi:MAG: class I SAM-dependent DNA methyltransferase [Paracoccaceae bacterium]
MDNRTIDIYNKNAAEYANLDIDKVSLKAYGDFSNALPKNGLVLDYGCGPGYFARKFLADGFEVDAFDASEKMIEIASMEKQINWWVADFKLFRATKKYDGIWANFSLLHAAKKEITPFIKTIFKSLKPHGLFSIGLKLGTGEQRDKIGRKYSYFEEQEIRNILSNEGFYHIFHHLGEAKGLDGESAKFIIILSHA